MKTLGQTAEEKIAYLRQNYGNVAILVTRELDHSYKWDGDGPDPQDFAFFPYTVSVKAVTVAAGKLVEAVASLVGSYYQLDEPTGDVHGYLPQMIDEAVRDLNIKLLEGTT